jgi:site-specific recombinase XerD
MQSIIRQTETTSNALEELSPVIEEFGRLLGLSLVQTTCKQEINTLRRFFTYAQLGRKHYTSITQADIEAYALAQSWSQHTRAHGLFCIKRFYEYLKEKGLVQANPAAAIKIVYPKHQQLMQVPTLTDIKKVFRMLEKDKNMQGLRLRLMVELAYGSGLRAGEIATLNVEDINSSNQTAHVLGKGRKERVVPLTSRCMLALERYFKTIKEPRKPLFVQVKGPCRGQRVNPSSVSQLIRIKTGFHAHLYRHACATHLLLAGCNVCHIQELLGHEDITTTYFYTRLKHEELRQVLNKKHPCAMRIIPPSYLHMRS